MDQQYGTGLWRNFSVVLTGKTNGAHQPIVEMLKRLGHREVKSLDDCDYLLVFCPAVSRVQSDIEDGLSRIYADKPVILVVMHHTFNPNHVVAESRRLVTSQGVVLTVDCLFQGQSLLTCNRNDISYYEIQRFLQLPISLDSSTLMTWMKDHHRQILAVVVGLLLIGIILMILFIAF